MKMIYKTLLSIVLSVAMFVSFQAWAGTKTTYNVNITGTFITGSFGSARNSADTSQVLHIGDTGTVATIWARNAAGTIASCTTNNASHLSALRSATSNSYLLTTYSGGTCNSVNVYKGSLFAPKVL